MKIFFKCCLATALMVSALVSNVNATEVEAYTDAQVDSMGTTKVNNARSSQADFQRVILSAGCILGLKSEHDEGPLLEFHVRLLRCTPLYVGLSFDIWHSNIVTANYTGEFRTPVYGVSLLEMFPPMVHLKRVSVGIFEQFGYYSFYSTPEYYHEPSENFDSSKLRYNKYYFGNTLGVYLKYRGLHLTIGYALSNIDLEPYGNGRKKGLFRKPTVHGLSVAFRLGLW